MAGSSPAMTKKRIIFKHGGIELRGRGPARERAAAFQHVGQIWILIFGNIA
jgi:hypothetical protein